jgi:uncharacterized integral membrane protein (TIGR00697 family)
MSIEQLVFAFYELSPELMTLLTLVSSYIFIIVLAIVGGVEGLYIYSAVAIIACNLQVLKAAQYSWYGEPIALGTVVFASSFLASDIINEFWGPKAARKSVFLSFMASILLLALMIPAIGMKPLAVEVGHEYYHFNLSHQALLTLFTPNLAILTASLISYFISQFLDIYIFARLKAMTKTKHLWLRTLLSVFIAVLVDTVVFNSLAWKIFAPIPVSMYQLLHSYMISGFIFQVIVCIMNVPIFYFITRFISAKRFNNVS